MNDCIGLLAPGLGGVGPAPPIWVSQYLTHLSRHRHGGLAQPWLLVPVSLPHVMSPIPARHLVRCLLLTCLCDRHTYCHAQAAGRP